MIGDVNEFNENESGDTVNTFGELRQTSQINVVDQKHMN